jgi:hypothetical protein
MILCLDAGMVNEGAGIYKQDHKTISRVITSNQSRDCCSDVTVDLENFLNG